MNIHKKVDELLEELIYCDLRTQVGTDKAKDKIRLALKKQDRDTRHACAKEATKGSFWSDSPNVDVVRVVKIDHVHSAIMNCQGGIGCKVL